MPRLRQAVLAARDLQAAVERLRSELVLGEPFRDEAVGYFGLENAVFAIGDQFEVDLDDIVEGHLHPADMRGAIVSVSQPEPASEWRWGGEGWRGRAVLHP